jgi:hypothetical protein
VEYKEYLAQIVALSKQVKSPELSVYYPAAINSKAKQALYEKEDEKAREYAFRCENDMPFTWEGGRREQLKFSSR